MWSAFPSYPLPSALPLFTFPSYPEIGVKERGWPMLPPGREIDKRREGENNHSCLLSMSTAPPLKACFSPIEVNISLLYLLEIY